MKKSELIESISQSAGISKDLAAVTLKATLDAVTLALSRGGSVTLTGFGTFHLATRSARMGRHPRTGAPLTIPVAKLARFRAGKALRDAVK